MAFLAGYFHHFARLRIPHPAGFKLLYFESSYSGPSNIFSGRGDFQKSISYGIERALRARFCWKFIRCSLHDGIYHVPLAHRGL